MMMRMGLSDMHTIKNLKGELVEVDEAGMKLLKKIRAKDPFASIPFEEGVVVGFDPLRDGWDDLDEAAEELDNAGEWEYGA